MTDIVSFDVQQLIKQWIEAERNGEQFPVPFDIAWKIAGYSRKDSAKRYLPKSSRGKFFHVYVEKPKGKGRPKENIKLTTDGLQHLCLMADTEEGESVRQLFIETKKKWDLVQQIAPEVVNEAELLNLKIQLATIEAQKSSTDLQLAQFRHYITSALPEPQQQKILGYTEIKQVEYRDRTITPDGDRLDGVGITYIQRRFGLKSTKKAWAWLNSIGYGKDSGKWKPELTAVESYKLDASFLDELDKLADNGDRQRWIGE